MLVHFFRPYLFTLLILTISTSVFAEFTTVWQKSLPETGLSGVCVKNGLIFFTVNDIEDAKFSENNNQGKKGIIGLNIKGKCYDLDGNFKWEVKLKGEGKKGLPILDCWLDATAVTPAANDQYVFFLNVLGELVCCTHDGQVKWRKKYQTNAGITPSKLILYKDKLIVNLPSGDKAGKYNLYCLQALNPETGELIWKSDKPLTHACRYDLTSVDGKPTILASVTELSHYKIGQGDQVYNISPDDGKCLKHTRTDPFMQHFRCVQYDKQFVTISGNGNLNFTEFSNGSVKKLKTQNCGTYYKWSGTEYQSKGAKDLKQEVKFGKLKLPTKATLNLYGSKLFYFSGGTNAIYCYDLETQKRVCVEVPYQIIGGKKIWDYTDIVYTKGIFDSQGRVVRNVTSSHGYLGYGWGHVNIAEPLSIDDKLYWLGGIGVIYIIDLSKPFSPDSIETVTIDPVGEAWTYGKMAYADGHIYLRSQKDLFKLKLK